MGPFPQHNASEIHLSCCTSFLPFYCQIPLYGYTTVLFFFLINSPIEEHLGYFQILAITNRAAIYIHVHLYFYVNVSVHFSTVDTQEK